MEHGHHIILTKAHEGIYGGHYAGKAIAQEILCARLWWSTICQQFLNMQRNIFRLVMFVRG
jgi:hypothetical protein